MRKKIPISIKLLIASSQNWACNICNEKLDARFDLDHITPRHKNGTDDPSNLQAICVRCHADKTYIENINRMLNTSERFCVKCKHIYSFYFIHECNQF